MRFPKFNPNRFTVFFALILALLGVIPSAAQSDVPYLYYYAPILNAFVIERADGSDSRMFAQNVMPPEHLIVWELGWSPSGEWLVWLSAPEYNVNGPTRYAVWLANLDGRSLSVLDGAQTFTSAYWSADEDVFYAVDSRGTGDRVYRVDAASGEVAAQSNPEPEPSSDTGWAYNVSSAPSPDGRYSVAMSGAALTDTQTGVELPMRHFSGYVDYTCGVDWHSGSQWFLRDDNMVYAGGGCGGGIVASNVTRTVQRELSGCAVGGGTCADWLPERVIPLLVPGLDHSVIPEPYLTLEREGDLMAVGWRRDGMALAAYEETRDEAGLEQHLLIWTFEDGAPVLTDVFEADYCYSQIFNGCEIEWSPDGTRIALTNDFTTQIIDVASGETVHAEETSFGGWMDSGQPVLTGTEGDADYDPARGLLARVFGGGDARFNSADIIDAATGAEYHRYDAAELYPEIVALVFLSDGLGAAMLEGGTPKIWNFADDSFHPLPVSPGDYITDLSVFGSYIVGFGRAALVNIWDTSSGKLVTRLNRFGWGAAFSPDGRTIATVGAQAVNLWDVAAVLPP